MAMKISVETSSPVPLLYIRTMSDRIRILTIATFNAGKLAEYREMLSEFDLEIRALEDFPNLSEIDETAATFAGNASLKATGYAIATGSFTLADDSGLEVAALEGRPGVLSARYLGEGTSFTEKMASLLEELRLTGSDDRRARFVCEAAIADKSGTILFSARGECRGKLAAKPAGSNGFGFDPIFIPDGFKQTFGELSAGEKRSISHRAAAFEQIIRYLRENTAV